MTDQPNSAVISESYRKLQQDLHQNPAYGVASLEFAPFVAKLIRDTKTRSVSDYGAGKQNLRKGLEAQGLQIDYRPYDPAFPEYGPAVSADLVCCIDVLEHIEPEYVDNVLAELGALVTRLGIFTVHTGPAKKMLADGRNAHLIQKPTSWWLPRLCQHFEIAFLKRVQNGFFVIVSPTTPA